MATVPEILYKVLAANVITSAAGVGRSATELTVMVADAGEGGLFHAPEPAPSDTYTKLAAAPAAPFGSCRYASAILACSTVIGLSPN